jgi:hypothetical protein
MPQLIKGESSYWINKNSLVKGSFEWADEYYAVSVKAGGVKHQSIISCIFGIIYII